MDDKVVQDDANASPHDDDHVASCVSELGSLSPSGTGTFPLGGLLCARHEYGPVVTGSRERVWERPLDRGKFGTGHYVLLLMRLVCACAMSVVSYLRSLMRSFVLVVVSDCAVWSVVYLT